MRKSQKVSLVVCFVIFLLGMSVMLLGMQDRLPGAIHLGIFLIVGSIGGGLVVHKLLGPTQQ